MSFITESKKVYRQVQILEKENSDHEISMARSELESTADKALAISSMLQSKSDIGNPLEAWVQSKITKAKDYITSVHDYLKYTPGMNESFDLEENTFEKIYQMQQDGKSSEDIAKELKLNPALVKKVLGEQIELKEFTDAQIAALKKEYDPLKGKTITTAQYQQLKNILFKLKDGDLEKLQKQNIPFASTGAGSILRVRKAPVKITSVKVPGLEGMAEEKIDLQEKPSRKKHVVFKVGDKLVAKDFRGYNDDEIAKSIDDFLKQNSKSIVVQQSPIQSVTEEPKNPYAIGMAAAMKATGDTPPLKKSTITKAHKIADKVKEEEVKESTSRNINEGARALVEAIAALQKKADKSGMPYSILKQVYDRGMAAWKGGHRPGAGQHQWAFARVNSFVTKSSGTWGGADSDLAKKVKGKE